MHGSTAYVKLVTVRCLTPHLSVSTTIRYLCAHYLMCGTDDTSTSPFSRKRDATRMHHQAPWLAIRGMLYVIGTAVCRWQQQFPNSLSSQDTARPRDNNSTCFPACLPACPQATPGNARALSYVCHSPLLARETHHHTLIAKLL